MTSLLHKELGQLEKQLLALTAIVEENVQLSFRALTERDVALAEKLIASDEEVNRKEVELEEECLKILALHQPVANDLRMIVAILKINSNLERIADQAVNISERTVDLAKFAHMDCPLNLEDMAQKVILMLGQAIEALINADLELAQAVLELDDEVDILHGRNYGLFKDYIRKAPETIDTVLSYLTVSRHLERVADLATNIAEDVIYLNEGTIVRHTIA
ncbi:phosphate signaling complex protein PhoU [Deltaproteobacteria bacterium IMCC39524]|nr:phosphate signaling complex protein PhoU [Deltaproteobacteria bacterium IMCC39524]